MSLRKKYYVDTSYNSKEDFILDYCNRNILIKEKNLNILIKE